MSETLIMDTFLQLIIIILFAKTLATIFRHFKQSRVLGQLVAGLILGPSLLGFIDLTNITILFIAELGVIMLLFETGLESNLSELLKSGKAALLVALLGVLGPLLLALGYLTMTGFDLTIAFFIGATLTATSIGLTIAVLKDINKVGSIEGKIILGAAIIDDIIGLILLSVLADIAATGSVIPASIIQTIILAIGFLVGAIVIGKFLEKHLLTYVHKFKVERSFIVTAFVFAILMSFISAEIGLATIVGAFAAGLVLEREEHREHIWNKTRVIAAIFAPVFFVVAGAAVDLNAIIKPDILPLVIVLSIIAIVGKMISGLGALKTKAKKLVIGAGMLPRGEVGLIFANFGLANGLVQGDLYSAIIAVIMITTFMTPPLIKHFFEN